MTTIAHVVVQPGAPFKLTDLRKDSVTQFRAKDLSADRVDELASRIEEGVKWDKPIRIADVNGEYDLIDGHTRVRAYHSLERNEIPQGQYVFVMCKSLREVKLLAMQANSKNGAGNKKADYAKMMEALCDEFIDEMRRPNNPYIIDWEKVVELSGMPTRTAKDLAGAKNEKLEETLHQLIKLHLDVEDTVAQMHRDLGVPESTLRDHIKKIEAQEAQASTLKEAARAETLAEDDGDDEDTAAPPTADQGEKDEARKAYVEACSALKKAKALVERRDKALKKAELEVKAAEAAHAEAIEEARKCGLELTEATE